MTCGVVLTAEEMRTAEARAIAAGTPVEELMDHAGRAAAEAIWRFAGPMRALILCGPGNNGGDGYVIARILAQRGMTVRVAALAPPTTDAAQAACRLWTGEIGALSAADPAPLLVDALFGTGLRRGLEGEIAGVLNRLAAQAAVRVAVDLPSGIATNSGAILSAVPDFDLTISFQTLKPAHLLQPAARHMGRLVVADIGLQPQSMLSEVGRPIFARPGPDDHKFRRGYVAVMAGEMPGAAALSASAALRSGAGYVRLFAASIVPGIAASIVQSPGSAFEPDPRIGAILIGPGLGRDTGARQQLEAAAGSAPLVMDADALHLIAGEERIFDRPTVLTPHEGEFDRLFGRSAADKVTRTREAAVRSGAVILFKGPDSVVAAPDGRAALLAAPHWLATAGTGDVLAGIVAARMAAGSAPFEAAKEALWLHRRAAERAGSFLIADDLIDQLPGAAGECV